MYKIKYSSIAQTFLFESLFHVSVKTQSKNDLSTRKENYTEDEKTIVLVNEWINIGKIDSITMT